MSQGTRWTKAEILADAALLASARGLVAQGYLQVSRTHCVLARVPDGLTGQEALLQEARREGMSQADAQEWVARLGERAARSQYCRVYGESLKVSADLLVAFRHVGGETA